MQGDTHAYPRAGAARLERFDVVVLVFACLLVLAHAAWFDHTADDAFISFRYVDNWIHGEGLVFNPGERVMGYSNFLWVVLLAPFGLAGVPIPLAARLLGAAFACATLVRLYTFLRGEYPGRTPALAAVLALVANGCFALWIFGGLEGHLLTFLLVLGATDALATDAAAPRTRFVRLGVIFGLASLTRPEAIAYVAPIAGWLWLGRRDLRRGLDAALMAGVAFAFWLALALFAWAYYGDPLPNTYYAKAHPLSLSLIDRGLLLTRHFFADFLWAPTLIIVAWLVAIRASLQARGWLPLAIMATFLAFFLRVGGDVLVYHRMWLPMLPMFALLLAEAVARTRRPWQGGVLAAAVAALFVQNSLVGPTLEYLREDDAFIADLHVIGERLGEMPGDTVVAANNIGVIAFESRLAIVDMLGLTDAHIARAPGKLIGIPAHESHDGEYVLRVRPDVILFGTPRIVDVADANRPPDNSPYPSDRDLIASDAFHRDYVLRYIELADGRFIPVFAHRTFDAAFDCTQGEAEALAVARTEGSS